VALEVRPNVRREEQVIVTNVRFTFQYAMLIITVDEQDPAQVLNPSDHSQIVSYAMELAKEDGFTFRLSDAYVELEAF
jgi:hypothetical protein